MLNTTYDIRNEVIVRMNTNTTSAYYTETILNTWVDQAYRWATNYKKWPHTEYMDSSMVPNSQGQANYPSNFFSEAFIPCRASSAMASKSANFGEETFLRARETVVEPDACRYKNACELRSESFFLHKFFQVIRERIRL